MSPKDCHKPTEERPGRLFLSSIFKRVKELRLSPSKRLVLCDLYSYLGDKDYCFPSQKSIAEDTGLTERTVRTLLKELAEKGVIEISIREGTRRKHGNHAYEYRLKITHNESQTGNLKQNQTGNPCPPNRKSATTKPEICDCRTGNLRHSKVTEKQASRKRAGAEYVKDKSKEKSVNQSRTDGLTDTKKKTSSNKGPASNHSGPLASEKKGEVLALGNMGGETFVPPPGAPPCLPPEKINALFGGPAPRPRNLLACPEGDFVLSDLTDPFKKGPEVKEVIGFDPNTPQDRWFEEALKEFSREAFDRHWNRKAESQPGPPFKRLFDQAGRSGLLYVYGFHPLSPEQQDMRRRELERHKEERRRELERQKEKEAEADRLLAQRKAKLTKFINRPVVSEYLLLNHFSLKDHEAIKAHLCEIGDCIGNSALTAVEGFMQGEVQDAKVKKWRREQIKELRRLAEEDPRLIEGFVQKGCLSEADDFIVLEDECLDCLLAIGEEHQIDELGDMAEVFISSLRQ